MHNQIMLSQSLLLMFASLTDWLTCLHAIMLCKRKIVICIVSISMGVKFKRVYVWQKKQSTLLYPFSSVLVF